MDFEVVTRWNQYRRRVANDYCRLEQMRRNNRGLRTLVETHEELKAKQAEKIEQLQKVLRDVESWTALDGDGISQPLLDRVRVAIGLPSEETNGSE
jgi:hypothetical protein